MWILIVIGTIVKILIGIFKLLIEVSNSMGKD